MTATLINDSKFFLSKKFFFYFRNAKQIYIQKSAELINTFGGQIETFLEQDVSYVLTDVPKREWPPHCKDSTLELALRLNVKLMSIRDLFEWCSKYATSQFSSDDDDDATRANVKRIKAPFFKFEDANCRFAPSVKEFARWPEVNMVNLPLGRSIFSDTNILGTPQQQQQYTGFKKRNSPHCEVCNQKILDRIEDHIQTDVHRDNINRIDWTQVKKVVDGLPSFSTLNMKRLTNLTSPPNGFEEFLCLHKVESVSQLFNDDGLHGGIKIL